MITITADDINDSNVERNLFPLTLDETDEGARVFMEAMVSVKILTDSGKQKLNEVGIT